MVRRPEVQVSTSTAFVHSLPKSVSIVSQLVTDDVTIAYDRSRIVCASLINDAHRQEVGSSQIENERENREMHVPD